MPGKSLFAEIFQPDWLLRTAILCEHRTVTYDELRELTIQTAEKLKAAGLNSGERVAILLNDSPEFIASFVAITSLGAIAVPINMALRKEDHLFILKDCGARIAIVEADAVEKFFGQIEPESELPTLERLLVVGRNNAPIVELGKLETADFYEAERAALEQFPTAHGNVDAFILYTSGSTGEPKGAVHSTSDIFYTNQTFCREVLQLREGDRLFSSSRLPFAYGLGNAFTFPLLNGHTTVLCRERPSAEIISKVLHENRPTIFFGVPVVYRMLLEHHRHGNELDTSSLRLCVSAGEALPAQLGEDWQRTFGVKVLDGIGSTEMLHMFMSNHENDIRHGSSGKLLEGYATRLIDHEGAPTPAGEVGNLWIQGESAASRYWERPRTTEETFVDGWVRTGDLYRVDEQGFWWHMGRSDDCFKPTGQWVSPVEVEGVLSRSDQIRAAAVVEGFDKDGLSCVCAFIVGGETGDEQSVERSLRELCKSALPRFKQPRRYIFVSELPYTATGKVQRFKLREQLRSPKSNVQGQTS